MIDTIDFCFSVGYQTREDKGCAGPQIGRHYLGSGQVGHSFDNGDITGHLNVRPHASQFADMDKTVFKDGFGNGAGAVRDAHQHHKLGLHIRRKSRIGLGLNIDAGNVLPALYMDAFAANVNFGAGKPQLVYQCPDMIRFAI